MPRLPDDAYTESGCRSVRERQFDSEQRKAAPRAGQNGGQWVPGDAPSQALRWATEAVAKAGTIEVYPPQHDSFPVGTAMNRNLTIRLGN